MPIFALSTHSGFPPAELASPEGLLAFGGDLSPRRLLLAYCRGIFPWYTEDEPILWWSPDPRLVLYPKDFHLARRLRRTLRAGRFRLSADLAFGEVIRECGRVRCETGEGTWLVPEMVAAYVRLHEQGFAHSFEAWCGGRLAGGLYGVSLGGCFFGESMFTRVRDASKAALAALVGFSLARGIALIDCQVTTGHLQRLGAREVPRKEFLAELERLLSRPTLRGRWRFEPERDLAALGLPAGCPGGAATEGP